MEEKIIVQGKKTKKSLNLLKTFFLMETIFAILILILGVYLELSFLMPIALSLLVLALFIFLAYLASKKVIIKVSDLKVYGSYGLIFTTDFDLPIDSINSIETYKKSKGFAIRTSSRTIAFSDIDNVTQITQTISELVSSRNNKSNSVNFSIPQSNADELKKFKELLDSGIITQEEFDAKKKQLLGL